MEEEGDHKEDAGTGVDAKTQTFEKSQITEVSVTSENPKLIGKDNKGRFAKGNKLGPGPTSYAKCAAKWRRAIIKCTDTEQVKRVWRRLCKEAESGDVPSMTLFFKMCFGKDGTIFADDQRSAITIQVLNLMNHPGSFELANQLARQLATHSETGAIPQFVDANLAATSNDGEKTGLDDPRHQDEGEPGGG